MKEDLLVRLRDGSPLSSGQQLRLVAQLSLPAIMAQISSIVMQYIDASMVGRLGSGESASIGLVMSSTWLFGDLCIAAAVGFTVQVSQRIGAGEQRTARSIMKQALVLTAGFSLLLACIAAAISGGLPVWLGAEEAIRRNATLYLLIYSASLPFIQLNTVASGMLQASGNMKVPSILHVVMCFLDVVFNLLLIFPTRSVMGFTLPGAGLGVLGAALGTALAHVVTALTLLWFLLFRSKMLKLRRGEPLRFDRGQIRMGIRISLPVAAEYTVMCGAQILATRIVAPLGTVAIAANSFAVTAESLCYMPGYGISTAAATLIGQSVGAKRADMINRFGWLTTGLGMAVMTLTGAMLYLAAPLMMGLLSKDPAVVALGVEVLRIEAFAEPLFAASIVASGVFRGNGDTLVPSVMSFCTMWLIRLPAAALLAPRIGLRGVWIAMCAELCIRGVLFLIRLIGKRWMRPKAAPQTGEV